MTKRKMLNELKAGKVISDFWVGILERALPLVKKSDLQKFYLSRIMEVKLKKVV